MIQLLIVFGAAATMAAAFATGLHPGAWFFTRMTGFFPPHYGYSAYIVTALLFLAPHRWLRGAAGVALLLSGNRAAWVGGLAGWGWSRGWRRPALLATLVAAAVIGGLAFKPRKDNDTIRAHIWRAALHDIARHPRGTWPDGWCTAVDGKVACKAHSDVLQLAVVGGWAAAVLAALLLALGLWRAPEGPYKDLVVCLTAQSVIDNRLHHPACAALYALAWLGALLEQHEPEE